MKTSSNMINIYQYFIRDNLRDKARKDRAKEIGIGFSEEIFGRHRSLIGLIKSYEDENKIGMKELSEFVRNVSELGKEELTKQAEFLERMRDVVAISQP